MLAEHEFAQALPAAELMLWMARMSRDCGTHYRAPVRKFSYGTTKHYFPYHLQFYASQESGQYSYSANRMRTWIS